MWPLINVSSNLHTTDVKLLYVCVWVCGCVCVARAYVLSA